MTNIAYPEKMYLPKSTSNVNGPRLSRDKVLCTIADDTSSESDAALQEDTQKQFYRNVSLLVSLSLAS